MRTFGKVLFLMGLLLIFSGLVYFQRDNLATLFYTTFSSGNHKTYIEKNEYYRDYDFEFVQNTNSFSPHNYQDLLNIFYTIINSGVDQFTFYCANDYKNCVDDVDSLSHNKSLLSDINNYVHPFNSYSNIDITFDNLGKTTVSITKTYSMEEIDRINDEVNRIYSSLYSDDLSSPDKIQLFHDYIINHSKYDSLRSDQGIIRYNSDKAIGPLFEGYAICSGYTDLMELFLEKMHFKSFKVSSSRHIWNAVLLGNIWYHIDLTWDDPVASNGNDYLEHHYFLITTSELNNLDDNDHLYDSNSYVDVKK